MNNLSKERIEYIRQHVKYLPDKEYRYLVTITKKWCSGNLFPCNVIAQEVLSLLDKQLVFFKIGKYKVGDYTYKFAVLPTIIGYEYIMKEKAPSKIELPSIIKQNEEEDIDSEVEAVDCSQYYVELSADTEDRLSDYDDTEIGNMSVPDFLGKVLGLYGVKPHPKQLLLKEIADNLIVEDSMDTERFIVVNKLQSKLGFVIALNPCDIEIWCGKVLEYLKNHKEYV